MRNKHITRKESCCLTSTSVGFPPTYYMLLPTSQCAPPSADIYQPPRTAFQYVAAILGASSDELKLITSFLISYPLAAVLKRIPDGKPALKNLFIIR